jgi:hypothetical protein
MDTAETKKLSPLVGVGRIRPDQGRFQDQGRINAGSKPDSGRIKAGLDRISAFSPQLFPNMSMNQRMIAAHTPHYHYKTVIQIKHSHYSSLFLPFRPA